MLIFKSKLIALDPPPPGRPKKLSRKEVVYWLFILLLNAFTVKNLGLFNLLSNPKKIKLIEANGLDIEFPSRFDNTDVLQLVIDTRLNPPLPNRPLALLIYPKDDWNGAFRSNNIKELQQKGYQIYYYEARTVRDIRYILEEIGHQKSVDLLVLGGHGNETSLVIDKNTLPPELTITREEVEFLSSEMDELGFDATLITRIANDHSRIGISVPSSVYELVNFLSSYCNIKDTMSYINTILDKLVPVKSELHSYYLRWLGQIIWQDYRLVHLDRSNVEILKGLENFLTPDTPIILESCSTGKEIRNSADVSYPNLADSIASCFPGHTVFAPQAVTHSPKYVYAENNKIIDVLYGINVYMMRIGVRTYKARLDKQNEDLQTNDGYMPKELSLGKYPEGYESLLCTALAHLISSQYYRQPDYTIEHLVALAQRLADIVYDLEHSGTNTGFVADALKLHIDNNTGIVSIDFGPSPYAVLPNVTDRTFQLILAPDTFAEIDCIEKGDGIPVD